MQKYSTILKIGNSLRTTIPPELIQARGIRAYDRIAWTIKDGVATLEFLRPLECEARASEPQGEEATVPAE